LQGNINSKVKYYYRLEAHEKLWKKTPYEKCMEPKITKKHFNISLVVGEKKNTHMVQTHKNRLSSLRFYYMCIIKEEKTKYMFNECS